MGVGAPVFSKMEKCISIFESFDIIHACMYYIHTYIMQISNAKYNHMWPTKKEKIENYTSSNSRNKIITATFGHFVVFV
jgi:hypothetical protein